MPSIKTRPDSIQAIPDATSLGDRAGSRNAASVLERLLRDYDGQLAARLWDGTTLAFGAGPPRATVTFNEARVLRELALAGDPLRLADAYFRGAIDVEGDIYEALRLRWHFSRLSLSALERARLLAAAMLIRDDRGGAMPSDQAPRGDVRGPVPAHRNTAESIAYHYDVSNAFYRLWLDEQMVYSCAVWEGEEDSLEAAQVRKLDLILRKLRLRPGERLLDIGCGWGALVIRAARDYGARAHGITLSTDQYNYARERIAALGLEGRASVELADYREVKGDRAWHKIASVGMFEHVGLANLPQYFAAARRLLAPGGLFLNHGITSREGGWSKSLSTQFINRYVFPDGELDTIAGILRTMEEGGFEILHVESLRPHYARTLREWVRRLESRHEAAAREAGEAVYRIWQLYMAACALQFEDGDTNVYQVLLADPWATPA